MRNILKARTLTYRLRSQTEFVRGCVSTPSCCLNSLKYFASKFGICFPYKENVNSFQKVETEIQKYAHENFSYYLY